MIVVFLYHTHLLLKDSGLDTQPFLSYIFTKITFKFMIQKLLLMLRCFLTVFLTKNLGIHFNCLNDTGLASCKYIFVKQDHINSGYLVEQSYQLSQFL